MYIIFDLDGRCFRENCHVCMRAIDDSCKSELLLLFHSVIFVYINKGINISVYFN